MEGGGLVLAGDEEVDVGGVVDGGDGEGEAEGRGGAVVADGGDDAGLFFQDDVVGKREAMCPLGPMPRRMRSKRGHWPGKCDISVSS